MTKPPKVRRKIYIVGEINDEAYLQFSKTLTKFEDISKKPIEIELFSGGGTADAAMAFRGRMKTSPCALHVKAYGLVASAASLILISGDYRSMHKDAMMMIHENSDVYKGRTTKVEREVQHARRVEDHWNKIFEEDSKMSALSWDNRNRLETFIDAEDCLILGAIDKVL